MIGILKIKKTALYAVMILTIMFAAASAPAVVNAASNPLIFTVEQSFIASAAADGIFTYRFKALDPTNPMPTGSAPDGFSFTIAGNGKAQIGPVSYESEGVYKYKLYQAVASEKSGYLYDRRVYEINIYVSAKFETSIVAYNEDGTKTDEIIFENFYYMPPPPKPPPPNIPNIPNIPETNPATETPAIPQPATEYPPIVYNTTEQATIPATEPPIEPPTADRNKWNRNPSSTESILTPPSIITPPNNMPPNKLITNSREQTETNDDYIPKTISETGNGKSPPKTGDNVIILLYIALIALSGAAIYLLLAVRKKDNTKTQ